MTTTTEAIIDHIAAAAAIKGITLTPEQLAIALATLESDIASHTKRVDAWIAAGVEYHETAAICNVEAKAKAAVRHAITAY